MNVVSNLRADEPGDRPVSGVQPTGPTVLRIGLGARLRHKREIDVPLYAFSTGLTDGKVALGARRMAFRSRVPHARIVDDRHTSHLDPLSAAPRSNRFLTTVVPFLRAIS